MKTKGLKILSVIVGVFVLSIGNGYAQSNDIDPIYSGTIHGNCFMVGATNAQVDLPANTTIDREEYEKTKDLLPILKKPGGAEKYYDSPSATAASHSFTISNINYADFCIDNIKECGDISIECARLTWGGRYDTHGNLPNEVYIKITNSAGESLQMENVSLNNYIKVSGSTTPIASSEDLANDGFYAFHVDILNIIKALVTDKNFQGGNYRIYVANVPVKLINTNESAGRFCGWNFAMVYSHPLLPRRSIMLYEGDQFGESKQTGTTPQPIYSNMQFGNAEPYNYKDTISFVYAAFGGMAIQFEDKIYSNVNGDLTHTVATSNPKHYSKGEVLPFYDQDCALENISTTNENHFQGKINYVYEGKKCTIHNFEDYSRGYDLQKTTLAPGEYKYIKKGGTSFNIILGPATEYHFFTNALIYIGAPDGPEAALPMQVDKTDIQPNSDFTCTLYVKSGNNRNGLTNVEVTVPISEYVDSIADLDIEFLKYLTDSHNKKRKKNN